MLLMNLEETEKYDKKREWKIVFYKMKREFLTITCAIFKRYYNSL